MTKIEPPIPIYKLALLQAYLYQIFSFEKHCEKNFNNTNWYLRENFSEEEINKILFFFNQQGLNCDCDIIQKLDLRKLSNIKFHSLND